MMKKTALILMVAAGMLNVACGQEATTPRFRIEQSMDIAAVPSDLQVGFCLLTAEGRQYVAYYDKDRQMTVASRTVDSDQWQYQILPSMVGWDSHNYITMAVDIDGHLHVSGNMHAAPLTYFRTEKAGDITTLRKLSMSGEQRNTCHAGLPRGTRSHPKWFCGNGNSAN